LGDIDIHMVASLQLEWAAAHVDETSPALKQLAAGVSPLSTGEFDTS